MLELIESVKKHGVLVPAIARPKPDGGYELVAELQKIRKCVDIALKAEQPERTQTRTKRHDIDR